jgi:hypothetical protein
VQIVPLGLPVPPGVGSVGPIDGFGCGPSPSAAETDAIQQLQVKALRTRATAVVDVLVESGGTGLCTAGYKATANGTAVAARGIPSTF